MYCEQNSSFPRQASSRALQVFFHQEKSHGYRGNSLLLSVRGSFVHQTTSDRGRRGNRGTEIQMYMYFVLFIGILHISYIQIPSTK